MEKNITMEQFLNDNMLLQLQYLDFNTKLEIALSIVTALINNSGYINQSLLRRFSVETIIEAISNIDMKEKCSNGLSGYDYMCYTENGYEVIKKYLNPQFEQFMEIIKEQANDYNDGRWVIKNET